MFKKTNYIFRLELNGSTLKEISSADIKGDISIGRGSDCTWVLPQEDRSASTHHAKIYKKGGNFHIQDIGSRNGIYYMGQKIQDRKLSAGELYSIGDCKLLVELDYTEEKKKESQEQYHKLEQLSGPDKGKIYKLTTNSVKIGAATDCFIVLSDSLVSRVHAVLEIHKDDTCWIKDMGSRNGTKVNGTPLSIENKETGRMLKDGDVISIAYFDFRFWDRTVFHVRSHLYLKIGVVVATLAIALGGYFMFQTVSPSARRIRFNAEAYAANEEFDKAKSLLVAATTARGADADAYQRKELMRKLDIWRETLSTWKQIQEELGGESTMSLSQVNSLFAKLVSSDRERWQWDVTTASIEMSKAMETEALLSAFLGMENRISRSDEDISYIRELKVRLDTALKNCRKNRQPFQATLIAKSEDLLKEVEQELLEHDMIQKIIEGYSSFKDTDETISRLETLKAELAKRGVARATEGKAFSNGNEVQIKKLLAILYDLRESAKLLSQNYTALAQYDFKAFQKSLHLPSAEDCVLSPNLSARRAEMDSANQRLWQVSLQLKSFQEIFRENDLIPGKKSEFLENVFSISIWETVLDCDCLKQQLPTFTEKTPKSLYDRMLGVYVFWEYLRSIGGDFDTTILDDRFKPDIFRLKEICNHLEVFVTFAIPSQKSRFANDMKLLLNEKNGANRLSANLKLARDILKRQKTLMRRMQDIYREEPTSRRGIIAGGVALCLTSEEEQAKAADFAEGVAQSLKKLRQGFSALSERGLDTTPEKILANERKLLELGIPGDPFLKQPWTDQIGKGR